MYKYILRRLIQAVPTFFGITVLAYMLMSLTPGGPLAALVLQGGRPLTAQQQEELGDRLGLNDPVPIQYLRWLIGDDWMRFDTDGDGIRDSPGERKGILRGDFGSSYFNQRPVIDVLVERLPATLELSIAALLVGLILGITVGIIAAITRGGVFDNITRVMAVVVNSIPNFWLGLVLLYFLAFELGWFPLGGRCRTTLAAGCPPIYERLEYMILPVIVLSAAGIANYSRFMRASMLDVTGQDYIRTARAKGLSSQRVWFRHGMRNALIPIATFIGPSITGLLGGAVITEQVFNYPGVGLAVLNAFTQRDFPVVMAVTIYAAVATIIGYLISDILYGIIDPRIRY